MNFRRPLGLALAGGGAHGAWQSGALDALREAGLEFDAVIGFSAGALTGLSYFLGREHELAAHWNDIESHRIMRLRPSWRTRSLFASASIWEAVDLARDEQRAKRDARCDLTVISLCRDDGEPHYARFAKDASRWDGPLADRVVASCTIPLIWPEVRIDGRAFVDGGVIGRSTIRFDALEGCADVIVLQMVRPEEYRPRLPLLPWRYLNQAARNVVLRQMDSGVASLAALPRLPRVWRVVPSVPLAFSMLDFRNRLSRSAYALGAADARSFLASL